MWCSYSAKEREKSGFSAAGTPQSTACSARNSVFWMDAYARIPVPGHCLSKPHIGYSS